MSCPLCGSGKTEPFSIVEDRSYRSCPACRLVFMDPRHRLNPASEAARYRNHRNDPGDAGYRGFLDRMADPISRKLRPGSRGLDYGCGPGPTLSVMLGERGFPMEVYDPYFAADPAVFDRTYDFITCTEAVEHFREPGAEFRRIDSLLKAGGWLGIMTDMLETGTAFADWYYVRDPTHIGFYRRETMGWIGRTHGWKVEFPGRTVTLFEKPGGP